MNSLNPLNRNPKKRLNNQPITRRLRRGFALYAVAALACCLATPVLAAGDPLAVIDNLNTFIFSIIRAVGLILLGWALCRWASRCKTMTRASAARGF